ncbi:SMN family protein [Abortiporus biennis]
MRPIISYDDITDPGTQPAKSTNASPAAQLGPQIPSNSNQPPTKRRKTNQKASRQQQQQRSHQYVQHWDDPSANTEQMSYDDLPKANTSVPYDEQEEYEEIDEEEESRELTHEEIWDDSALIEAWDSANAEYEAYHGGKNWKDEPTKKSPLWYNVPTSPSKSKKSKSTALPTSGNQEAAQVQRPVINGATEDGDSKPLNFDTFVPDHDPSLSAGTAPPHPPEIPGPDYVQYYMPNPPGPMVSQDEAFQRALSAMYWGGYWTAVYHCQRQTQNGSYDEGAAGNHGEEEEVEVDEDENENENR